MIDLLTTFKKNYMKNHITLKNLKEFLSSLDKQEYIDVSSCTSCLTAQYFMNKNKVDDCVALIDTVKSGFGSDDSEKIDPRFALWNHIIISSNGCCEFTVSELLEVITELEGPYDFQSLIDSSDFMYEEDEEDAYEMLEALNLNEE